MLIVIVVIWILAGALLPKIMWVTSRARDTKRVADLRNVAMAIQRYKMDTGEFPKLDDCWWHDKGACWFCTMFWDIKRLQGSLSNYIQKIPKDPQKNNTIKIHYTPITNEMAWKWFNNDTYWHWDHRKKWWHAQNPWEYLYQIFKYHWDNSWGAVLVAKVETPSSANYILSNPRHHSTPWGAWKRPGIDSSGCWERTQNQMEELYLCSSVKKVEKWQEEPATADNSECAYSSEDQLFYVMKI